MTQALLAQAKRLLALKEEVKAREAELKGVKTERDNLATGLAEQMEALGLETFALADTLFYIRSTLHASVPAEHRETFIRRLRARKLGYLVRPVVQANTLTGFVKEQVEENGGALPKWMEGLVNVYTSAEAAARKR